MIIEDKNTINNLLQENRLVLLALWDNYDNAANYYNNKKESNTYIAYNEGNPEHAFSTPIKVYRLI